MSFIYFVLQIVFNGPNNLCFMEKLTIEFIYWIFLIQNIKGTFLYVCSQICNSQY